MIKRLVTVGLLAASVGAQANLITNGSNDDPLVGGEIQGWTEVVGTNWTQRSSNPVAHDGPSYFFAGAGASAVLSQTIDLSTFASGIDAGLQQFAFSGWIRSFNQVPTDSSRIVLSWLAADASTLDSFDSGQLTNRTAWQQVTDLRLAPALSRSLRVDLIATRNNGSNNDGYFDALVLETSTLPVPEPASSLLLALGVGALAMRRLKQRA